jgi:polyhydroxyalkanoate synthesis regulator phasin
MKSLIKRSMMLGIGITALTKDKITKVVSEVKKKGDLTHKESKELINYLVKESEKKHIELKKVIQSHVKKALIEAKKETKKDLLKLEKKLIKKMKK